MSLGRNCVHYTNIRCSVSSCIFMSDIFSASVLETFCAHPQNTKRSIRKNCIDLYLLLRSLTTGAFCGTRIHGLLLVIDSCPSVQLQEAVINIRRSVRRAICHHQLCWRLIQQPLALIGLSSSHPGIAQNICILTSKRRRCEL